MGGCNSEQLDNNTNRWKAEEHEFQQVLLTLACSPAFKVISYNIHNLTL